MHSFKVVICLLLFLSLFGSGGFAQDGAGVSLHEQAVRLAREGDFEAAISHIHKALYASEYAPEVIADFIVILSWAERYEEAIEQFDLLPDEYTLPDYVQLGLARAFRATAEYDQAIILYNRYLDLHPGDLEARKGVVLCYWDAGKYILAQGLLNNILAVDPYNAELLFIRGELQEAAQDYLKAYQTYDRITSRFPENQSARDLQYRALIHLGANSLVRDILDSSQDTIDIEVRRILWGNESMAYVQWGEYGNALRLLEQHHLYAKFNSKNLRSAADSPHPFALRTRFDRIVALRQAYLMRKVLAEYELLLAEQIDPPLWMLTAVADAYLYARQPEQAQALYEYVYEPGKDYLGKQRMARYHCLIETGEYRDADAVLEEVDAELPVRIFERGFLQDNWAKADVALNKGWWLLYQDRLAEAEMYLDDIHVRAPGNTSIRSALAHTYLWRGWPRLALEEFQIIRTVDPKLVAAHIGCCAALNENDQWRLARDEAAELLANHPNNLHVQKINRQFEIQDMRRLILHAAFTAEDPGVDEFRWSARFDQPIDPWRNVFAELQWRDSEQTAFRDELRRGAVGLDWRINRDWFWLSALSVDVEGDEDAGWLNRLTWHADDYWSTSLSYDTYSLNVPARARVRGITADQTGLDITYRDSELFRINASAQTLDFSDGNQQLAYLMQIDRGITTAAYWKTRLGIEGYYGTYDRQDVPYFSPETLYSIYLVPMVEHVWFRRYERALVDRLFLGLGTQGQKGFGSDGVWYVRYEQDHALSDTFYVLVGTTVSHRIYDGEATDAWNIDITITYHF